MTCAILSLLPVQRGEGAQRADEGRLRAFHAPTPLPHALDSERAVIALSRLLQRLPDLESADSRAALYAAHAIPPEDIAAFDAPATRRARLWRDRIKPGGKP